jgi:hypothetical protein
MSRSLPRYYVEKLASLDPDTHTGIVKLTFSVEDESSEEPIVQLVVSAPHLHEIFGKVSATMQKTFGGPGGMGGKRKTPVERDAELPDITSE